jgi:undecaprenyl-diphosphatase
MEWISLLGTRYVIGAILAGVAGWVLVTGRCRKALMVLIVAFFADFALEIILKQGIGRPRPDILRLVPGRGPSFPSGHVLATVGFYGLLAVVAWKSTVGALARSAAYIAATAVILTVGVSRMYLGVHWFSDVMAGMLVGTAFVLAAARFLRGHHLSAARSCCATA